MGLFQQFEFTSFKDFENWKTKEEDVTNTRFVKERVDRERIGFVFKAFRCHRSGNYVPRGGGARYLKAQGSHKINGKCPSRITVQCFNKGNVAVKYYPHHEGHTNDPSHLFIRREQKEKIASKILLGVPFSDIMEQTRKEAGNDVSLQLIKKQDLKNISKSYGIDKSILDEVDTMELGFMNVGEECHNADTDDQLKSVTDEVDDVLNKCKNNPIHLKMFREAVKKVRAEIELLETKNSSLCTYKNSEPGNTKIEPQRMFLKAKKRSTRKSAITKSSVLGQHDVVNILINVDNYYDHSYGRNY